jgi:metal-responsive CopG/Arc/MetJ family transcriptional regulator
MQLLQTKFPPELVGEIDAYCANYGMTRSEFLRRSAKTQLASLNEGVTIGANELGDIMRAHNELSTLLYGVDIRAVTETK